MDRVALCISDPARISKRGLKDVCQIGPARPWTGVNLKKRIERIFSKASSGVLEYVNLKKRIERILWGHCVDSAHIGNLKKRIESFGHKVWVPNHISVF